MADKFYCKNCGSVNAGKLRGSGWITILLLICYIIPGLIYEIWRYAGARRCMVCGTQGLIPVGSPMAPQQIPETVSSTEETNKIFGIHADDVKDWGTQAFILLCVFILGAALPQMIPVQPDTKRMLFFVSLGLLITGFALRRMDFITKHTRVFTALLACTLVLSAAFGQTSENDLKNLKEKDPQAFLQKLEASGDHEKWLVELQAIDPKRYEVEKAKDDEKRKVEEAENKAAADEQSKKDAEPVSSWSYEISKDTITQKDTWIAATTSINSLFFQAPYNGEQKATLILRNSPKARHGKDVIIRIERGQILCDNYDGCSLLVRFDDQPPEKYHATTSADHSSDVLFLNQYDRFLKKALHAKKVFIEITVYENGNIVLEFDVANLKQKDDQEKAGVASKPAK